MASSVSPPLGRPLYGLEDTAKWTQKLREQYQRVLAPLSLFPTNFSRLKPLESESSLVAHDEDEVPVPISLSALMQLVKARLEPGPPAAARVHPQHLRTFRHTILSEVKQAHKDLQHLLHDSGFSPDANRELYQHLVSYLGLVCHHLFCHYVGLMDCCRVRHIFTDCANSIRFSAQLALDCSKFLNMVDVRQRLVWEMKRQGDRPTELPDKSSSPFGPLTTHSLGNRLGMTVSYFIRYIRPHTLTEKEKVALDVKELEDLPLLDMSKVKKLKLPAPKKPDFLQQMAVAAAAAPCPHDASRNWSRPQIIPVTSVLKCQSLPNMRVGKLLADELGIRLIPCRISPELLCRCPESPEHGELMGPTALAEDLRRLTQESVLEKYPWKGEQEDLDLPPLIRVLTWTKASENRHLHLERMLKSLGDEERLEIKRRNTIIAAPASHPQAATVNVRISDKMVVKTADLQVSERHYVESVTMDWALPIYNHLLGEINSATVKMLDKNLSGGEEVQEIYLELMNTIPKEYLKFDQGSLIECHATTLPRYSCFASSTLSRKKNEQIVNAELNQILPLGPFVPEEVTEPAQATNVSKKKLASKEYASWFKWWKATFNIDEYLKYISSNNSDYLPVIFHLYNPEEEDKEGKERDMQSLLTEDEVKKQKVKRKQLKAAELQSQKEQFQAGFWNVNSSWLEGLGMFTTDQNLEDFNVLQRRMERLWTVLHFSEQERLDMAIKYSSNQYYLLLPDMLNSWEIAAQFIQDRELLLAEIEEFEQTASDPNRLFSKELSSFGIRVHESKVRSHLNSELEQYNFELSTILKHINEAYNDTVTFKGRPYQDKMDRDLVEMLYWLQQERRAAVLKEAVEGRSSKRLSAF